MAAPSLPPFSCTYTPAFADLLAQLGCSLLLSTYQAGKLITLSSDGERIVQLPRTFQVPMGVALDGPRMAVATQQEVVVLVDVPELAATYPSKPGTYDAMFLPRTVYFTGQLNLHDLAWVGDRLIAVNTSFSCLCEIASSHSFRPIWQPPFITDLLHEDRCHLNGMAVDESGPRYATAFAPSNVPQGWRPTKTHSGILLDVPSNEMVSSGLPMPHSPRLVGGELYLLLSATGEVVQIDVRSGDFNVVNRIAGFVRGMDYHGNYLFVGTSRLRKTHTFGDLALAQRDDLICGITAIHLPTGAIVGQLAYQNSCEEIYDVRVLPGRRRPNILSHLQDVHRAAVTIPGATFWGAVPEPTPPSRHGV